jgi:hypothetical protein
VRTRGLALGFSSAQFNACWKAMKLTLQKMAPWSGYAVNFQGAGVPQPGSRRTRRSGTSIFGVPQTTSALGIVIILAGSPAGPPLTSM